MILKEYDLSIRLPQERTIDTGIILTQNDKDVYKFNIRVFDGVNEIDYSNVTTATITFSKADKNAVQGDMVVGVDKLTYTLGTNEIACPGKVLVSVQLWGTTERLTTANFSMLITKDLISENVVESTSEFSILQQLKKDLEAIDVVDLTNQFNAHTAESASKHIKESGSNANGSYIKFDDGTMICYTNSFILQRHISIDTLLESDWVYPSIFIAPPSLVASLQTNSAFWTDISNRNKVAIVGFEAPSINISKLRCYSITGQTFTSGLQVSGVEIITIGRWK